MSRRLLLALGCLAIFAFAAYGSFVPFHFQRLPLATAVDRFRAVPFANPPTASNTDLVANVLLFVPIGLTLAGALAERSRTLSWLGGAREDRG